MILRKKHNSKFSTPSRILKIQDPYCLCRNNHQQLKIYYQPVLCKLGVVLSSLFMNSKGKRLSDVAKF